MTTILGVAFLVGVVINLCIFQRLNSLATEVISQAERMNESCTEMANVNQQISKSLKEATQHFKE